MVQAGLVLGGLEAFLGAAADLEKSVRKPDPNSLIWRRQGCPAAHGITGRSLLLGKVWQPESGNQAGGAFYPRWCQALDRFADLQYAAAADERMILHEPDGRVGIRGLDH